jgi:hypothetical protein
MHAHGRREARAMQRSQRSPIAAGLLRIVRRAGCGVRRASCVVRRASCVVRRASCVVEGGGGMERLQTLLPDEQLMPFARG